MPEHQPAPIIVKKKAAGHGGHHGGAWKVAYADFVTAMMALFIVLWLMNTSKKVQEAVGGYFRDPSGQGKLSGNGVAGADHKLDVTKDAMPALKERVQEALAKLPDFQKMKNQVEMALTGEGLRIELLETDTGMFFESGNAVPTREGEELLRVLAKELGAIPNQVLIEGHTDSRPFAGAGNYSNWELSADRANAARRLMQSAGLRADQVVQVRGFADQALKKHDDPAHPWNRRVSVLVKSSPAGREEAPAPAASSPPKTGGALAAGHPRPS